MPIAKASDAELGLGNLTLGLRYLLGRWPTHFALEANLSLPTAGDDDSALLGFLAHLADDPGLYLDEHPYAASRRPPPPRLQCRLHPAGQSAAGPVRLFRQRHLSVRRAGRGRARRSLGGPHRRARRPHRPVRDDTTSWALRAGPRFGGGGLSLGAHVYLPLDQAARDSEVWGLGATFGPTSSGADATLVAPGRTSSS